MKPGRLRAEVLRALIGYYELRGLIETAFGRGKLDDVVRVSDVATFVAGKLDAELSPQFRRRVRHAAGLGGWSRTVNRANVLWYRGMVKK